VPAIPEALDAVLGSQTASIAADAALYLNGLVRAASQLDVDVCHHTRGDVERSAANAMGMKPAEIPAFLKALGHQLGPPWRKDHWDAAAAAIAALSNVGK